MLALALALSWLWGLEVALPPPEPPPPADAAWRAVKTVDGVALSRAPSPRPAPWGAAEGDIEAPIERVIAHLLDFAALKRLMPRLAELRLLERGSDEALVYFRFDLPWPVSDRDWTVRYRWQRRGDGFVMTWSDANDRGPPPGRAVRVAPLRGSWELWPRGAGRTHGRYVFLAELGGSLPHGVIEQTSWKEPLQTFRGVRAATAH